MTDSERSNTPHYCVKAAVHAGPRCERQCPGCEWHDKGVQSETALNSAAQERPLNTNGGRATGHIGQPSECLTARGEAPRVPARAECDDKLHAAMPRTFEYLLNSMERAAQAHNPHREGYAEKRKAVFQYVEDLWVDYIRLLRDKQDALGVPSAGGRISDRCQNCPWPKDGCSFPKCGQVVAPSATALWISTNERLPEDETPVVIVWNGQTRIGEIRWDHPGHEETYVAYRYWDDPTDDGQAWDWREVTHWMPLPSAPTDRSSAKP